MQKSASIMQIVCNITASHFFLLTRQYTQAVIACFTRIKTGIQAMSFNYKEGMSDV